MASNVTDDLDIRRPDLKGVRRTGTVRWYKDEKGHGRITADDGEVLFAHFSDVEGEGYTALNEGERVSFIWDGNLWDPPSPRGSPRPASATRRLSAREKLHRAQRDPQLAHPRATQRPASRPTQLLRCPN